MIRNFSIHQSACWVTVRSPLGKELNITGLARLTQPTSFHYGNRGQQGFSLVELMVAMVLGLFLMGGVIQFSLANKVTYRLQEGLGRIQETGRYALHFIGQSARGAGYFGCAGLELVTPNVIAKNPPADMSSLTTDTPISGLENVATGNAYGAVAGSDVLILRGLAEEGIGLTGNTTPVNANIQVQVTKGNVTFEADDLILIADCAGADLFRATSVSKSGTKTTIVHASSANNTNNLSRAYGADATVAKPFINHFYVKDTGRNNSAGQPILGLFRRDMDGVDEELAEGVSDFQVLYGVDRDANHEADIYQNAASVTGGGDWDHVVSVRISLLLDSIEEVLQAPAAYDFQGVSQTPADRKLRREFTGLFTLRNRAL